MQPVKTNQIKPRLFVDADVLFGGAAAPSAYGASLVVLRMAEITLIEAFTCQQVIHEVQRNLANKLPGAIPAFDLLVNRCLKVLPNPQLKDISEYEGLADVKDLPILAAAINAGCPWLTTFNLRHYQPGHRAVTVLRPGDFVLRVRDLLASI